MPPKKSGKQLTADQVAMLAPMGRAGGTWSTHWAFEAPQEARPARRQERRLGRSMRSIGSSWPGSRPRGSRHHRGRQDDADPPRDPRPDRPAADPRARSTRSWPTVAGRLMRRSSTACSTRPATASTWRGSGSTPPATATPTACTSTTIARSGPTATGSSTPSTPTSPSTGSSSSNSPATCLPNADARPDHRHRLQPLPRFDQRGGLDRRGSLRPQRRRPGRYQRDRLPGPDHRLRPLPRPQVRPDPGEGLLPALRVLQQHRRPRTGRQFGQMGAHRPGAEPEASSGAPGRRRPDRRHATRRSRPRRPRRSAAYDIKADAAESEAAARSDFVWIDDAIPPGASPQGDGPWNFVGKPDHPVFSGKPRVAQSRPRGSISGSSTTPGTSSRSAPANACLLMSISIRPILPRELMLQWHTKRGLDAPRVLGRERDRLGYRRHSRAAAGSATCPPRRKWVRLEVPVAKLKLKPGTIIDGWAFTQHGGTVYWDKAGIADRDAAGRPAL